MEDFNREMMKIAIDEANENSKTNFQNGGPFGAVIVKNDEIISRAHNMVIKNQDPTAHAEINAIRLAAQKLGTHDLSDCVLYTSAEPCPMCLSAIIWANIKEVYYANTKEDADKIGFRDDMIYEFIKNGNSKILKLEHIETDEAIKTFEEFDKNIKSVMY